MAKSTVKILREFYREQDKEISNRIDPDDVQILEKILSVENPVVRIAKRKKLSFTIADGDEIIKVNPDDTRNIIGKVKSKDVRIIRRTISIP